MNLKELLVLTQLQRKAQRNHCFLVTKEDEAQFKFIEKEVPERILKILSALSYPTPEAPKIQTPAPSAPEDTTV